LRALGPTAHADAVLSRGSATALPAFVAAAAAKIERRGADAFPAAVDDDLWVAASAAGMLICGFLHAPNDRTPAIARFPIRPARDRDMALARRFGAFFGSSARGMRAFDGCVPPELVPARTAFGCAERFRRDGGVPHAEDRLVGWHRSTLSGPGITLLWRALDQSARRLHAVTDVRLPGHPHGLPDLQLIRRALVPDCIECYTEEGGALLCVFHRYASAGAAPSFSVHWTRRPFDLTWDAQTPELGTIRCRLLRAVDGGTLAAQCPGLRRRPSPSPRPTVDAPWTAMMMKKRKTAPSRCDENGGGGVEDSGSPPLLL
jgi:hypothetical protein